MAWSTPLTAVDGVALTAAQWNASVRDNLLETAAAKATTAGRHFVSTGMNTIAERAINTAAVDTTETTTSTTYTDLATNGPSVTLTTGTKALVWINSQIANSGTASSYASFAVTGASTLGAGDTIAIIYDPPTVGGSARGSVCDLRTVTAGSNTFTMQYRTNANTGTFYRRRLTVMGL